MNKINQFVLGLIISSILLTNTASASQQQSEVYIIAQQWKVKAIDNKPILSETPLTITFNTKGQFEGNSGCNMFNGKYKLSNSSLTFSDVVSTERACIDTGLNEQERMFMDVLLRTTKLKPAQNGDIELLDDTNHSITLSK